MIFISFSNLHAQNKADIPIHNAISSLDWFELRDVYEQSKDSLSEYTRLTAEVFIDYHFNNPAGVVEKVQEMYNDYNEFLASNFLSYFIRMTDCLGKLGRYEEAYAICRSILDQAANSQIDEVSRVRFEDNAIFFKYMRNYSAPELTIGNREEVVPFKYVDETICIPIVTNGIPTKVMLDTGAGRNTITEEYVKKLGLKISTDSIMFNDILTPITVIDSIMVGETLITNLYFAVIDKSQTAFKDYDIIIGSSLLLLFPEFELDYKSKEIIFRNYLPKRKNNPRNLAFDHLPYVKIDVQGIPAIFVWDTGGDRTIIRDIFYEKHKANFPEIGETKFKIATGTVTKWELKYAEIPEVELGIGDKIGVIKLVPVIENFPPFVNWFGIAADGIFGLKRPKGIDRLIVSYEKLYMIAE